MKCEVAIDMTGSYQNSHSKVSYCTMVSFEDSIVQFTSPCLFNTTHYKILKATITTFKLGKFVVFPYFTSNLLNLEFTQETLRQISVIVMEINFMDLYHDGYMSRHK